MAVSVGLPHETAIPLTEAVKRLPFGEDRLRRLIRDGVVPATRVQNRLYLFPSEILKSEIGALWK
jgi:hypothetical protein